MPRASPPTAETAQHVEGKRVVVVFEPGHAGAAALELARELVERERATLTVVSVVPQAASGSRCGGSALEYNSMVRDTVAHELDQAREQIAPISGQTAFELLIEGADPPLHEFIAAAGFELILLPAHRRPLRSVKHPAAAALSRLPGAEVRIVDRHGGGAA
jgi:hypothetical protein